MKYINTNLITLKCVLFLFFGAIGSLFPFLPIHMSLIGLSKDEAIQVSVVAPLIALIGPLVAAPLADRLAGGFRGAPRSKTGRYLRVMIAICLVLAIIFYWLLHAIPPVKKSPPKVSFVCNQEGGFIIQDRCGAERTCYNWGSTKGSISIKNCQFSCNATIGHTFDVTTENLDEEDTTTEFNDADYYSSGNGPLEFEGPLPPIYYENDTQANENGTYIPYPHMCFKNSSGDNKICEVFTNDSRPVNIRMSLKPTINTENDIYNTCKYPFAEYFQCRINPEVIKSLTGGDENCVPAIVCDIFEPYTNEDSLLKISQCGYDNISYWLYLFIRSFADIFPAAAATLLATAVVIATRETSTGRGDVGKQFAAGAFGFGIFALSIGDRSGSFLTAMICFTILMLLATLILLFDNNMPLSPPEWWWHTRCGLLALPMSSVRNYGLETGALGLILFLLGVFWNGIDAFLPWRIAKIDDVEDGIDTLLLGLTLTVAALPAVIFLVFAERIVDYCGHSNILIFCFINYIFHNLALACIETAGYLLLCEWLEIFTLHIMYVTAVLYLRHLVPRKATACGQALPIIAHFCLGRCFGALFGGMAYTDVQPDNFRKDVYQWFTVAAATVAVIYFLVYHFYMKPKCAATVHLPPDPAPAVVQSMNGNGSYTPLRVYHNSKSKKGHFRY